jgi:hypothetical protein
VDAIEMLGEQHHHQYYTVCEVIVKQSNCWLEDETRAKYMTDYGPVTCVSSIYARRCWCSGQMIDRTLPAMFNHIDGPSHMKQRQISDSHRLVNQFSMIARTFSICTAIVGRAPSSYPDKFNTAS